jgi:transcription elongation factor Elf1
MQTQTEIYCPHCGESLEILIDPSVTSQVYVEDCQICCRPMEIHAVIVDGEVDVRAEAMD